MTKITTANSSRLMVTISDNGVGIDEETLARLNAQMSSSCLLYTSRCV